MSAERVEIEALKRCPKCDGGKGAWLPRSAFYRNAGKSDGLQYRCRACSKAYAMANYDASYERLKARMAADPEFAKRRHAKMREWHEAAREREGPKPPRLFRTYRPEEGLRFCGKHDGGKGAWRPLDAFPASKRDAGGLGPECRDCRNARRRAEWRDPVKAAVRDRGNARTLARIKERYASDPAFRERVSEYSRAYRDRKRKEREQERASAPAHADREAA